MLELINRIQTSVPDASVRPFSMISSCGEQKLRNVPIVKPLFILVLEGHKQLGAPRTVECNAQQFVLLSADCTVTMRNIPKSNSYLALIIEFEPEDFEGLPVSGNRIVEPVIGDLSPALTSCLEQFVNLDSWAPKPLWAMRRKELLVLLHQLGISNVASLKGKQGLSYKLHELFCSSGFRDLSLAQICKHLAVSESTLRRRLKEEGGKGAATSVTAIKDRARFGLSLHLLQSTKLPISHVAEQCGYSSQSRFTERFKAHYGMTPSELRKTQVAFSG